MSKTKEQKKEQIEKLEQISKNKSIVFVHFKNITGNETVEMRKVLKKEGVGYLVPKKTLLNKVFSSSSFKGDAPEIEGEIAIAYGEDLLSPSRLIKESKKKFEDKLDIVGGVFDSVYKNKEEMNIIASIPEVDTLYAQFMAVTMSPIQKFTVVLNEYAKTK